MKSSWKHQIQTTEFCRTHKAVFDTSDPGTGKTRAHAESIRGSGRVLITCPTTLMRAAWGNDLDEFTPHLTYAYADADTRMDAFQSGAQVIIINTDGIKWVAENIKKLGNLKDFKRLIVDESAYYKHHTSQRSKALVKVSRYFDERACLTGTPNPISVTELWNQLFVLDDGKRLGTSFYQFRNSTQVSEQVGPSAQHVNWVDRPGAEEAVRELIADITIRHSFEEVMTHVPPNHTTAYEFELSKKAQKFYEEMRDTSILKLKDASTTAVHAAVLRSKLLQIASGAVYTVSEDDNSTYSLLCNKRYQFIADLVETREHSVTFFLWRHQKEELAREYAKRGITFAIIDGGVKPADRDRIVKQFQNGDLDNVLLHPATGAHGLTLTAGDTTFWASPTSQADFLKQGKHRIYRGAQDKVTNTVLVHAKNTVEAIVYERLNTRTSRMNDFLSMLEDSK